MHQNERPQDPSNALDQVMQDISNLPFEFKHIMEEIQLQDVKFWNVKKKWCNSESQIHKFIKQNGSLVEYNKEPKLIEDIIHDLDECYSFQLEKCILANTAVYLITKHVDKVKETIEFLEEDGLLAPLEEDTWESSNELSRESSLLSQVNIPDKKKKTNIPSNPSANSVVSSRKKRKIGGYTKSSSLNGCSLEDPSSEEIGEKHQNRNGFESLPYYNDELFSVSQQDEDDKQLYCFCQTVSYGEMVACDGVNCKYEWFHYGCVNLHEPPKGQWYCPDCKQEILNTKLKKKKKT